MDSVSRAGWENGIFKHDGMDIASLFRFFVVVVDAFVICRWMHTTLEGLSLKGSVMTR